MPTTSRPSREYLHGRLAALWPEASLLPAARNGVEALATIRDDEPDAAFLDIRMPGLTGLELASRIEGPTHVVFVTAYDEYAVEAFDRDAVDYLVKPVIDDRLSRAIERLKAKLAAHEAPPGSTRCSRASPPRCPAQAPASFAGCARSRARRSTRSPVEDVLYFQAQDKYTCVCTRDGELLIRTALSDIARQVDPETFAQVHRSTVVNLHFVASTRRDLGGRVFVRLKDARRTELPVSRGLRPPVSADVTPLKAAGSPGLRARIGAWKSC